MAKKKVTLILGAGSTVADVATRPVKSRPPLDRRFFSVTRGSPKVARISNYMRSVYDFDIYSSENDSLEKIMAMLYTDIYDPKIGTQAAETFRDLIRLFNRRLTQTTNNIKPTHRRLLYRMMVQYFEDGAQPDDLTVVTFNQDLQVEKMLHKLQNTSKHKKLGPIFNFPFCYLLAVDPTEITAPEQSTNPELFSIGNQKDGGVRIIKLHGSLNWYSTHRSPNVSPKAMFDPKRKLRITQRRLIAPDMRLTAKRRTYTLPIVIPPVTHKSGILHRKITNLWTLAESALKEADEIAVFGYSCPALDFESSNLIQRSIRQNKKYTRLSIIDPDSNAMKRYIDLIGPSRVGYYRTADFFLGRRQNQPEDQPTLQPPRERRSGPWRFLQTSDRQA